MKTRHEDYRKFVELGVLGTLALFALTIAWLSIGYPILEGSYEADLVYGFWFAYNFLGVIVGVIGQLFQKVAVIDNAFTSIIRKHAP